MFLCAYSVCNFRAVKMIIFGQLPVKMFHLWAGEVVFLVCIIVCVGIVCTAFVLSHHQAVSVICYVELASHLFCYKFLSLFFLQCRAVRVAVVVMNCILYLPSCQTIHTVLCMIVVTVHKLF